ncbi:MAG: hypothetical protein FWD17_10615, partial [Polyangiaceae bacterium]|nr:hypothetical protein [Polyangiaceae bacterium]
MPQNLAAYTYSQNNPVVIHDPDGRCPMCVTAAVGAGIGAVVGGAVYGFHSWRSGEFTWRGLGGSVASGAITGAVAGLTGGSSLVVQVGANATASVVAGAVSRGIEGKQVLDGNAIVADAVIGVASAGILAGTKAVASAATKAGAQDAAETVAREETEETERLL